MGGQIRKKKACKSELVSLFQIEDTLNVVSNVTTSLAKRCAWTLIVGKKWRC